MQSQRARASGFEGPRSSRALTPRRARLLPSALVRLFVAIVAVVALLSVGASTLTVQRVAAARTAAVFARACTARDGNTEVTMTLAGSQRRPRPQADDETRRGTDGGDVHALARRPGAVDTVLRRERGARADVEVEGESSLVLASEIATLQRADPQDADPGLGELPVDPPTRARARLMVFLN